MQRRARAIGALPLLAIACGLLVATPGTSSAKTAADAKATTTVPKLATSAKAIDPAIDLAARLAVVRALASHASTSTEQGGKVRTATFARVVDSLETAIALCDQASAAAKKQKGDTARASELTSLRRFVVAALTLAKEARDVQSSTKLAEVSSVVTKISPKALRLAEAAHPDAELMISAVALRSLLAETLGVAAKAKGTNGLVGEKGTNALVGEKGTNGLVGEKGTNGLVGEKGTNGLVGEKGTNALVGEKGTNAPDPDMVLVARALLDQVAKNATTVSKAKPLAEQLAGVRDALGAASKKGSSPWTVKRALQAAEWANETLIIELQKP
jgi:hypothetical protein